jgi:hypothetical protein
MSTTNHHAALKAKGLRVADLQAPLGMSLPGIYACLNENREPKNPVLAAVYRGLLGLDATPTTEPTTAPQGAA